MVVNLETILCERNTSFGPQYKKLVEEQERMQAAENCCINQLEVEEAERYLKRQVWQSKGMEENGAEKRVAAGPVGSGHQKHRGMYAVCLGL